MGEALDVYKTKIIVPYRSGAIAVQRFNALAGKLKEEGLLAVDQIDRNGPGGTQVAITGRLLQTSSRKRRFVLTRDLDRRFHEVAYQLQDEQEIGRYMMGSKVKAEFQGLHAGRYSREPLESDFALAWQKINQNWDTLSSLLWEGDHPADYQASSDRDKQVAATIIQWLGSEVGQGFLRGAISNSIETDRCERWRR